MTHAETIAYLSADIALLVLVAWVVIVFFILLSKVPFRKLHVPAQPPLKFKISDESEDLLPAEHWGQDHASCSTLAEFRGPGIQFQKATQQYNEDQLTYANKLWTISEELRSVLLDRDAEGLTSFLQHQKFMLQKRARASEGDSGLWKWISLIESLTWALSEFILRRRSRDTEQKPAGQGKTSRKALDNSQREPPGTHDIELGTTQLKTDARTPVNWMSEYKKFTFNVHTFCAHVGIAADPLLPPWDHLEALRTLAAEQRPEQAALVADREIDTQLRKELASLKESPLPYRFAEQWRN